jgi:DNA repair protein RadC
MRVNVESQVFFREVNVNYSGPQQAPVKIRSAADALTFLNAILKDNVREHFIALFLDRSHQIVSYSVVSIGTASSTLVHPREVFQRAILAGACGVILAHNHPSGQVDPSDEDRNSTDRLSHAGELLGIPVVDHIIFSGQAFNSAAEKGWLA